jgi:hypothetical protein
MVEFWPTNLPLLFKFLKRSKWKSGSNREKVYLLLFPEMRLPVADFGLFMLFK